MVTSYATSDTIDLLPHPYWILLMTAAVFILVKFIKIFSSPETPSVYTSLGCENRTIDAVINDCPSLHKMYVIRSGGTKL